MYLASKPRTHKERCPPIERIDTAHRPRTMIFMAIALATSATTKTQACVTLSESNSLASSEVREPGRNIVALSNEWGSVVSRDH
jgi:hypothetical protein